MSYDYKNIICAFLPHVKYHDDMFGEEVKVLAFPFMDVLGDFRVFNGLSISEVDEVIGEIRKTMIYLANRRKEIEREERLRAEREVKTE